MGYKEKYHSENQLWTFTVLLTIYSIVGTVGNTLVLIVYFKQRVQHVNTLQIRILGVVDLIISAVIIPYTICYEWRIVTSSVICKGIETVRHTLVVFSNIVMCLIALERYIAVHRPLNTLDFRKIWIGIWSGLAISMLLAVPSVLIISVSPSNSSVISSNASWENVSVCKYTTTVLGVTGTLVYQFMLLILFGVGVVVLIILYSLVYRVIWKRELDRTNRVGIFASNTQSSISRRPIANKPTCSASLKRPNNAKSTVHEERNTPIGILSSEIAGIRSIPQLSSTNPFNIQQSTAYSNCNKKDYILNELNTSPNVIRQTHADPQMSSAAPVDYSIFTASPFFKSNQNVAIRKESKGLANCSKNVNSKKAGTMLFACTVIYVVTWLPFFIDGFTSIGGLWFKYLFFISHMTNPLVYSFVNKHVRDEILFLLRFEYFRRCVMTKA